jgi:hypothetical protein
VPATKIEGLLGVTAIDSRITVVLVLVSLTIRELVSPASVAFRVGSRTPRALEVKINETMAKQTSNDERRTLRLICINPPNLNLAFVIPRAHATGRQISCAR